jgi:hypothetical protein
VLRAPLHQALTVKAVAAGKQVEGLAQQQITAVLAALLLGRHAVGPGLHGLQFLHGALCAVG